MIERLQNGICTLKEVQKMHAMVELAVDFNNKIQKKVFPDGIEKTFWEKLQSRIKKSLSITTENIGLTGAHNQHELK